MQAGGAPCNPRSVEAVFIDFKGRRAGMIKALTTDEQEFYRQCDPEMPNLCLYGYPCELWEVDLPVEDVPPLLPVPALGINFARDGMEKKDWLSLVAMYSDAWLLSVASYFGARFGFDKANRGRLLDMINDLPTIFEVVTGMAKKQGKEKSSVSNHKKSKTNSKRGSKPQEKYSKAMQSKDQDEDGLEVDDEEEHGETLCGACGLNCAGEACDFWICCDICDKWFHGKCVKVTPERAVHMNQYKCPSCREDGLEVDDEEECGETLCAACGLNYAGEACDFFICCDICDKWFHGKCVKVTPERAVYMKQYKCPSCRIKRARP